MNRVLNVISHGEQETFALAKRLAASFVSGDLLVLTGSLGAGKTVFVRGLAVGMGHDEESVNSPSFTIVNEYPGPTPLFHFDLYRLSDPGELYEIGWDDYLSRNGVVVVEWGEKAEGMLPDRYYLIDFGLIDDLQREINISLVQPQ
ncbi:MAG: tRNA (adenosine(37)-N6)-threonylcarbamoyltransferase complex ATPase subunit type 1 TsaE [Candidatus Zixiibacteriota bacterium]